MLQSDDAMPEMGLSSLGIGSIGVGKTDMYVLFGLKQMPYTLRKAPGQERFWVVNTSSGKKHSIEPLPKARAQAQMRALYAVEHGYQLRSRGRSRGRRSGRSKRSSRRLSGGKTSSSPSRRWVRSAVSKLRHPGSLSRKARSAGKSTRAFACSVLRSPRSFTLQTQRQAQFFVNINKQNRC